MVTFRGYIDNFGMGVLENSKVKAIKFEGEVHAIYDYAFEGLKLQNITYCSNMPVNGRALESMVPKPKIFVTDAYTAELFAGAPVTDKSMSYCPPPRTPSMTPLSTPTATEISIKNVGKTGKIIIGCVGGGIVLVAVIIIAVIPCIMKRNGWAKKETLTESLLTQTV